MKGVILLLSLSSPSVGLSRWRFQVKFAILHASVRFMRLFMIIPRLKIDFFVFLFFVSLVSGLSHKGKRCLCLNPGRLVFS